MKKTPAPLTPMSAPTQKNEPDLSASRDVARALLCYFTAEKGQDAKDFLTTTLKENVVIFKESFKSRAFFVEHAAPLLAFLKTAGFMDIQVEDHRLTFAIPHDPAERAQAIACVNARTLEQFHRQAEAAYDTVGPNATRWAETIGHTNNPVLRLEEIRVLQRALNAEETQCLVGIASLGGDVYTHGQRQWVRAIEEQKPTSRAKA